MRSLFLSLAATLVWASLTQAQGIVIQVQKSGKQVVTEIEQIKPPPPVVGKLDLGLPAPQPIDKKGGKQPEPLKPPMPIVAIPLVAAPSATAEVVKAFEWRCGRFFTDEKGKRWKLVAGYPLSHYPNQISGWRLVTVDGQISFFTVTGRLFTQMP